MDLPQPFPAPVNRCITAMLDNLDAAVYIADIATHEVVFINHFIKKQLGNVLGKKCYEVFQNQTSPCPFCTNEFLFTADGAPEKKIYKWEHYNPVHERWYELWDQAIQWFDGRIVRIEIALDITDKKKIDGELHLHHRILQSVLFAAERFLNCTDWHAEVQSVLEDLGQKAGVSMVCLYKWSSGNKGLGQLDLLSGWMAPDAVQNRQTTDSSTSLDLLHFDELSSGLGSREIFQKIVAELSSPREKQYFLQQGIQSFCKVPIILDQELWGALCFADCSKQRVWSPTEIGALKAAADILGAAVRRQAAEEELGLAHQQLERKVEQRTLELQRSHELLRREVAERKKTAEELDSRSRELMEVNITLKVLLQQSSAAKHDLEKNMEANFTKLVLPYLDDLQLMLPSGKKRELINIVKENLQQITSAFSVNVHKAGISLTSREIQIASFIKQGKTNKQIAELSGLSVRTVETYRNRIRQKLGIRNQKTNLQTYLANLSQL